MKRLIVLLLLVSVGLNLGLAWRLRTADRRSGWTHGSQIRAHREMVRDDRAWGRQVGRRLERLVTALDLTPQQADSLRRLHHESAGMLRRDLMVLDAARGRLLAAVAAPDMEPDSVRILMGRMSRRQAAVDSLAAERILREMEILEPEQRARYLELLPTDRLGGPDRPGFRRGSGRHGGGRRHSGDSSRTHNPG